MSLDDYDTTLDEPDDDTFTCEIHEYVYRYRCPHCAVDEADRRHDTQKEVQP